MSSKQRFLESHGLTEGVLDAAGDDHDAHGKMADVFLADPAARDEIVRLVGLCSTSGPMSLMKGARHSAERRGLGGRLPVVLD